MRTPSRLSAASLVALLLAPALLAPIPGAAAAGAEALLSFERPEGYALGEVGDLMRLEGVSLVTQPAGTRWQLRVLDPTGGERGRQDFVGTGFSGHLHVQLQQGDPVGAWRGEARRLDGASWVVLATATVQVRLAPPPAAPTLTLDASGNRVTASWTSDAAAPAVYEVVVDDSLTFESPELRLADAYDTTVTFTGRWLTTYHVRVRVKDAYHEYSPWTESSVRTAQALRTVGFERNAYYVGPETGDKLVAAAHALADAGTEWRLDVLDPTGGVARSVRGTGASVALVAEIPLGASAPLGQWKAEVWSRMGQEPWTQWQSATTQVSQPTAPGAPPLQPTATGLDVRLDWIPNGGHGRVTFDAQASRFPDFTSPLLDLQATLGTTAAFTGEWGATYHVRVRAVDPYGVRSAWTERAITLDPEPLPDLTIVAESIWTTPSQPRENEPATVHVRVENRGLLPAVAEAALLLDGAPAGAAQASLAKQSSAILSFPVTFPAAGARALQVRLDAANLVRERDETNNAATRTVTVLPPPVDLEVRASDLDVSPGIPLVGQMATITVSVRNLGTRASGPVALVVTLGATQLLRETVDVPAGGTVSRTLAWTPSAAGAHELRVKADADRWVREANETNNEAARVVSVSSGPDLRVDALSATPSAPFAGDDVQVSVTLRNAGSAAAPSTKLALTARGPALILLDTDAPALASGESRTLTVSWRPPLAGSWTLEAVADAPDEAAELDETNNARTATLAVAVRPLPDVRVELVAPPDVFRHNNPIRYSVRVTNDGDAAASDVEVAMRLRIGGDGAQSGVAIGTQRLPHVPAGEAVVLAFPWTSLEIGPGAQNLALVASATTPSAESSTTNNAAEHPVKLHAPDLVVEGPEGGAIVETSSAPNPLNPTLATRVVTIRNVGTLEAGRVVVWYDDGDGERMIELGASLPLGAERTIDLPQARDKTPGLRFVGVRASALSQASLPAGPWPGQVPMGRDLEPAVSRVDNSIHIPHVVPGVRASVFPRSALFEDGALPFSSGHGRSIAVLDVETFGASADSYLQGVPVVDAPWRVEEIAGAEGAVQESWEGDQPEQVRKLSARRVYHLVVPSVYELRSEHCPFFTRGHATCHGGAPGGWTRRIDAGEIAGVTTGYEYRLGLQFTTPSGFSLHADPIVVQTVFDGTLVHVRDEVVVLHEGRGVLKADVIAHRGGYPCKPSTQPPCRELAHAFSVVSANDPAKAHRLTVAWDSPDGLSVQVPSGFDFADNPVRLLTERSSESGPFWLLPRAPMFPTVGGQPQQLMPGVPALFQGGVHVLDAKVVGTGMKETDVIQAYVRLCYEPSKVAVQGDHDDTGWWGPDSYVAQQRLAAEGNADCGAGRAAAFRSMPLTRDNAATFSFLVHVLPNALGTATFTATVFNEHGRPPVAGAPEPNPWTISQTIVIFANPGGLVTDQLKAELNGRLGTLEAATDVALDSNDWAFLTLIMDVGAAWSDVATSAAWGKLQGKALRTETGKLLPPSENLRRYFAADAGAAIDDAAVESLVRLVVRGSGAPEVLAMYSGTKREAIDQILEKYRRGVADGSFFGPRFSVHAAAELVYKLDVAENMLKAAVHKNGTWTWPSSECKEPMVTAPQPGLHPRIGAPTSMICHNRPMHPTPSSVAPNALAHYYTQQKALLDAPFIKSATKWVEVGRIIATGSAVLFPNPITLGAYRVLTTADKAITLAQAALKTVAFAGATVAYPASQWAIPYVVEQATPDPRTNTDYATVAAAPGTRMEVEAAVLPGTLARVATLFVPTGSPEPVVHATTPGGVPVAPVRVPVEGGVQLVMDIAADALGNATIDVRGPSEGNVTPYVLAINDSLSADVRFVRLRITAAGEPIPGLSPTVTVDGVPTEALEVLGSGFEVRALQGSSLRVRATAPGHADLDRTIVVDQPERFGTVEVDVTPHVRGGALARATLNAGATGDVTLRVENPLPAEQTLTGHVVGLPSAIVATPTPRSVPPGGALDLPVSLVVPADLLPGILMGAFRVVNATGAVLREVPLRLTVVGPYADVWGLPRDVDLVAGQSSKLPLTLRNAGNADLRDVQVTLVGGPGWAVPSGAVATLAPGAEDAFELAFAPGGSQAASVTNATLRVTAMGAPAFEVPVRLHLHKVDFAPARVVAAEASDLDGDGAADAVEARAVGQSVVVGLRGASGEIGFEMLAHRVVLDGVTYVDTQSLSPTHAKGVNETVSIWRTSEASLVRTIRPEGDGVVVRLVASVPGGKVPQVVTTYETLGARDGDVLTGPWGGGMRAPALDLLALGDLAPAELTQQDALGAEIRLRPVIALDVLEARATLGVFPVSGRVGAVFDDAFLLEDATGGAWIETGARPSVLPGDVVWANVRGDGSQLRLVDLRVTGTSALAPPTVDRAGLLAAATERGNPLVDVAGAAVVSGGAIAVATASGDVPVDFVRGATPPPVSAGQAVRFRGVATSDGRLHAIPPFVAASSSGTLRAGWYVQPATVALQPHAAVTTDYAVDGGAATAYVGPFTLSTDGDHLVVARAWDARGNAAPARLRVPVDLTPPWTTLRVEGPLYPGDPPYLGTASRLVLDARDNASGVKVSTLCVDADCRPYDGPRAVESANAIVDVTYWSEDRAGHVEPPRSARFAQDLVAPTVTLQVGAPTLLKDGLLHAPPRSLLSVLAQDAGTGVAARFAAFDGGTRRAWDVAQALGLADGVHDVVGYALDRVGNEGSATLRVAVDGTAPVTSLKTAAVLRPGASFELAASDPITGGVAAGVERTTWGVASPDENVYAGPVPIVGDDGTAWVRARSVDRLGNLEATRLLGVRLDGTAPWAFAHVEGPGRPADQDLDGASDAAEAAAGSDPRERLSTPQTLEVTTGGAFAQGLGEWHVSGPAGAPSLEWVAENSPRRTAGADALADGALRLVGCGTGAALLEQPVRNPPGAPFVGVSLDLSADAALAPLDVTMVLLQGTTSFTRQVSVPASAALGGWARVELLASDFGVASGQVVPVEPVKLQVRLRCNATAVQGPLDVEHARLDNVRVFSGVAPGAPSEGAVVGAISVVARAVDATVNGVASGPARIEVYVDGALVANVTGDAATVPLPASASVRQVEVKAFDAAGNASTTRFRAPPSGA